MHSLLLGWAHGSFTVFAPCWRSASRHKTWKCAYVWTNARSGSRFWQCTDPSIGHPGRKWSTFSWRFGSHYRYGCRNINSHSKFPNEKGEQKNRNRNYCNQAFSVIFTEYPYKTVPDEENFQIRLPQPKALKVDGTVGNLLPSLRRAVLYYQCIDNESTSFSVNSTNIIAHALLC